MVHCRVERNCGGNSVMSTIEDCCDHDIDPFGVAYIMPGEVNCQLCPVGKRNGMCNAV